MEGDIAEVDGVLRIAAIRLTFHGVIPKGKTDEVERVLDFFAKGCPAYRSVEGCIDVSWRSALTEG